MKTLIAGATGATGRWLVKELLEREQMVRVIVRSPERLPEAVRGHANLEVIQASLLDLSDAELAQHVMGCDAVASCLGHNMTFKGMFGHPRRLVTDAARRLCEAVRANAPGKPVKYVLMNTVGNRNRDLDEGLGLGGTAGERSDGAGFAAVCGQCAGAGVSAYRDRAKRSCDRVGGGAAGQPDRRGRGDSV